MRGVIKFFIEKKKNQTKLSRYQVNQPFLKKLPADAEAAVLLVGRVAFLDKPISVFIRLAAPVVLGDLPEVDIPTR